MPSPQRPSRRRLFTGTFAGAAVIATALVALPAAGAGHTPDTPGDAVPVSSGATAAPTRPTSGRGAIAEPAARKTTSTPHPHCTGCVEHQVFGFEDGTAQRWQPVGRASAGVMRAYTAPPTLAAAPATSSGKVPVGQPHGGTRQLVAGGIGNGGWLRWPGTADAFLSGFQVRVWVRPQHRRGTLRLTVSGTGGSSSATALALPGVWTAITTPRWGTSDHSAATITLSQDDPCTDGDIGVIDLDNTAVSSAFDDRPVWRSDDASLLAPALPQITPSMIPCPTSPTTPPVTPPTVLDFEDGTTQGWIAGKATTLEVSDQAPLSGVYSLALSAGKPRAQAVKASLTARVDAFGGTGEWLVVRARAKAGAWTPPTTIRATCGPTRTVGGPPKVTLKVPGAAASIGGTSDLLRTDEVRLYLLPAAGASTVTIMLSTSQRLTGIFLDDVVLERTDDTPTTGSAAASHDAEEQMADTKC